MGVVIGGRAAVGYETPSRKLELYSATMRDWKWPEFALPEYIRSHVGPEALAAAGGATAGPGRGWHAACRMAAARSR